jgi:autonomous glycyl radical cofactor GrcA
MRFLFALALIGAAAAAHGHHGESESGHPYAGQETRDLKALSEEEVRQYQAGAGMGYAKAAELNHFPGPMHVLELAERLELSPQQRSAAKRLMDDHKAEARAIGAKVVAAERELESLFRAGSVDSRRLADAVRAAASLQGEYRLAHLETHRRVRLLLSEEQIERYDALRGYRRAGKTHAH